MPKPSPVYEKEKNYRARDLFPLCFHKLCLHDNFCYSFQDHNHLNKLFVMVSVLLLLPTQATRVAKTSKTKDNANTST